MDFVHQAPTFDPQLEPHHAAGGVDGRLGGRGRFRSRRLAGLLPHQQRRRTRTNRLYRNNGDGRFTDVAGAARRRRREPAPAPACRWARCGATTTTTATTICWSTSTAGRCSFTTSGGKGFVDGGRARRAAGVGQRQQRHLARLRSRRPARSVHRRLLARRASTCGGSRPRASCRRASSTRTTAAASTCCATRATAPSRTSPQAMGITSRRWTLAVAAADLRGTGYPDLFFANDYGVSELYANDGGKRFVDVAETTGVGAHAEERHERLVRRHLQRRPPGHLQGQHLGARRARAGQRSVGAEERRGAPASTTTWRRAWASTSAAGAGARSSAI